jgi:hypothetical protein
MKTPIVRDRSDANVNCGTITGRTDLCAPNPTPSSAHIPNNVEPEVPVNIGAVEGCTAREVDRGGVVVDKCSTTPTVARPSSGPLGNQRGNFTSTVGKSAKADLTTNKLAQGPAVSNPKFGFRNDRG